jgi:hypothetical protein
MCEYKLPLLDSFHSVMIYVLPFLNKYRYKATVITVLALKNFKGAPSFIRGSVSTVHQEHRHYLLLLQAYVVQ